MIQKRRVHSLNWLYKNCELDSCNNYYCITGVASFVTRMQELCGKIVTWDSRNHSIKEMSCYWEDWMFEPGEVE